MKDTMEFRLIAVLVHPRNVPYKLRSADRDRTATIVSIITVASAAGN